MRLTLILLIVFGVAVGVALAFMDDGREETALLQPAEIGTMESAGTVEGGTRIAALPGMEDDPAPLRQIVPRNVTPPGMMPAPRFDAPAQRAVRPSTQELEPEEPAKAETRRFHRVVVLDGGRVKAGDTVIQLEGVEMRAADAMCTDEAGREWPCGRQATAALQRFVRTRSIECEMGERAGEAMRAACRVGEADIAAWLVRQGWAEPMGEGAYADELAAAREDGLGLWAQPVAER